MCITIVLHTYIQTNPPIWKAVSFGQPPPVFLFCVQGFLVPVVCVTICYPTVWLFLSDVWGFTWSCCQVLLLWSVSDVSVQVLPDVHASVAVVLCCLSLAMVLLLCV